jgi:hypothetical protein
MTPLVLIWAKWPVTTLGSTLKSMSTILFDCDHLSQCLLEKRESQSVFRLNLCRVSFNLFEVV